MPTPDLAALDPRGEHSAVTIALAFLRLVVRNNPNAHVSELTARPDVQSAHQAIAGWLRQARTVSDAVLAASPTIPGWALDDVRGEAQGTLQKLRRDARISRANVQKWQTDDPHAWAAQLVLRMFWFTQWLQSHQDQQPPDGAEYKTWVSRLAENTCRYCRRLHGTTIPISESFAPFAQSVGFRRTYGGLFGPPLHPSCFPAGTPVAALGITGATKRVFVGDLIGIRVRGREEFSVTPNHPILTDRGWVSAGFLREGDQVVGDCGQEWKVRPNQHDHEVPTPIEEVADAFLGSGLVASREVPVAAVDFHGDAREGDVAVVGADRRLLADISAVVTQPIGDGHLGYGDVVQSVPVRASCGLSVFDRLLTASDGGMRRGGQRDSLLGAQSFHAYRLRLAAASGLHAVLGQDAADDSTTDAVRLRQTLLGLSGAIALQEVTKVRRYPWSGHVFNLQTADGWYMANGVTVHNCQCTLRFG